MNYIDLYMEIIKQNVLQGTPINPLMLRAVQGEFEKTGNANIAGFLQWVNGMAAGAGPEGLVAGDVYGANYTNKGPLGQQEGGARGMATPGMAPTVPPQIGGAGPSPLGTYSSEDARRKKQQDAENWAQISRKLNPFGGNPDQLATGTVPGGEGQIGPGSTSPERPAYNPPNVPDIGVGSGVNPSARADMSYDTQQQSYDQNQADLMAWYAQDPNTWLTGAGVDPMEVLQMGIPGLTSLYGQQQGRAGYWNEQIQPFLEQMPGLIALANPGDVQPDAFQMANAIPELAGALETPGAYIDPGALYASLMGSGDTPLYGGGDMSNLAPAEQIDIMNKSIGLLTPYLTDIGAGGLQMKYNQAVENWQNDRISGQIPETMDLVTYMKVHEGAESWL